MSHLKNIHSVSFLCKSVYAPVWGQFGPPLGNFICSYTIVTTQKWMNPSFHLKPYLFPNSSFIFQKYLMFLLVIHFTSTSQICNDWEICRYFYGHCQLISKQHTQLCFICVLCEKNPQTNQPNKEVKWLEEFHTGAVWHVAHLQSDTLVSQCLALSRPVSPPLEQKSISLSHPLKTELHVFLRMILPYPVLLLYLNFSGHSDILL